MPSKSAFLASLLAATAVAHAVPAFPGAEGPGAGASGGRAGSHYVVTSLAKSGPGSLAEAVSQRDRIVTFAVSGLIDLEGGRIEIAQPGITIAGQTAPGEGVCLRHGALRISASNVIVRHLRVRRGFIAEGDTGDAVEINPKDPSYVKSKHQGGDRDRAKEKLAAGETLRPVTDVVLDHVSASWATDENFTLSGHIDRIHAQRCLVAEALDYANPKQTPPRHAYGSLLGGAGADARVAVHHSVFAHHRRRTPQCSAGDGSGDPPAVVDFRNNIVYNSIHAFSHTGGHPIRMNFVGNYYRAGRSTEAEARGHWFTFVGKSRGAQLHASGNVVHDYPAIATDNWRGILCDGGMKFSEALRAERPFAAPPVSTQSADAAFEDNLRESGATLPARDAVDLRIAGDVRHGTGGAIDRETDLPPARRWPDYRGLPAPADDDADGLPDGWQRQFGIRGAMTIAHGYAHIEHWFNNTDPTGGGADIVFVGASVSRASAAQPGEWRVGRTGDLTSPITVGFAIDGAEAIEAHPETVTIPAGADSATIRALPKPGNGGKVLVLTLRASPAVKVGCPHRALIVVEP